MKMHDGCVHQGLRYSAYLRGLSSEDANVVIRRNDGHTDEYGRLTWTCVIPESIPIKLFGATISHETRSLTKIVELAITKIEEYDAVLETFAVEEEQ